MAEVIVTVSITRRVNVNLIILIKRGQVTGLKTKDGIMLAQRAVALVSF